MFIILSYYCYTHLFGLLHKKLSISGDKNSFIIKNIKSIKVVIGIANNEMFIETVIEDDERFYFTKNGYANGDKLSLILDL